MRTSAPLVDPTTTSRQRRAWVQPKVVELKAGGAEFNVGRVDDGVDRS